MSIFYTYEKSMEEEKRVFLRHLYHDKRGGQMIRLRISGKEVSQLSTCDMEQLAATGTDSANFYTTVNTFRGYKRESSRVLTIPQYLSIWTAIHMIWRKSGMQKIGRYVSWKLHTSPESCLFQQ